MKRIQSYVWDNNKCYFVSTINRSSSCMIEDVNYSETIVWNTDDNLKKTNIVFMCEDTTDSIHEHMRICDKILNGEFNEK